MGYKRALVLLPFFLVSSAVVAGKWNITPSIKIAESFTDNLFASAEDSQSSLITEISPGVSIFGQGKNLDTHFIYKLANVSYHSESELNDTYDYYNGNLQFKLLDNKWLINLAADKGRQIDTLANGISSGGSFISPNQVDVSHYSVGTTLSSKVAQIFRYRINLQANKVDSTGQIGNSEAYNGSVVLSNTNRVRNSYWQLAANSSEIKDRPSDNFNRQSFRSVSAQTGFRFSDDYWLFLQYYDQDNNLRANNSSNLDSSSYGAGLRWFPSDKIDIKLSYNKSLDDRNDDFAAVELRIKPSQRTMLYFNSSQRFYGDYYEALFNYRLKRFSANLSYNEQISSYNLNSFNQPLLGDLICPIGDQFSLSDCTLSTSIFQTLDPGQQIIGSVEFFPQELSTFLEKRLNANFNYTKRKVNVFVSLSRTDRTGLDTQDERIENNFNWRTSLELNARSNIELSYSYRDSKANSDQFTQSTAKDQIISLDYNHRLTPSTFGRITLSHRNRDATGSLNSYDENRIAISVTKEF